MAFPTTPVLDNFNRANENPVSNGGLWSQPLKSGQNFLQLVTNTITTQATEQRCSSYWNTPFSADQEIYVDIPDFESLLSLHLRQTSPNSASRNGYSCELSALTGPDNITFFRCDSASDTQIGSTFSASFTVGDGIGLEMIGSTLTVYHRPGASGTWTSVGSTTDSTYSSSGVIGVEGFSFSLNPLADNFGGGTVVVVPDGVRSKVIQGTASTATGTQIFTSPGFGTPKAAILIMGGASNNATVTTHARMSIGITDGTTQAVISAREEDGQANTDTNQNAASNAIISFLDTGTTASDAVASFSQWVTDGIEINWTNPPSLAHKITVILLTGIDLDAVVKLVTPSSTENATHTVTGVGSESDVLITISRMVDPFDDIPQSGSDVGLGLVHNNKSGTITQRSLNYRGQNAQTVGDARARYQTDRILRRTSGAAANDVGIEISAFNADGWEGITRDDAGPVFYAALALNFNGAINSWVGTEVLPVATNTVLHSGAGFKPQFVLQFLNHLEDTTHSTSGNAGSIAISAVDASQSTCIGITNEDGAATSNCKSLTDTIPIHLMDHNATTGFLANFVSFENTGFQYGYTAVKAGSKQVPTLVLEEFVAPPPAPGGGAAHSRIGIPIGISI